MTPADLRIPGRRLLVEPTIGDMHMALLGLATSEHRSAAETIRTLWDRVQHLEHELEMINADRNAAKAARTPAPAGRNDGRVPRTSPVVQALG